MTKDRNRNIERDIRDQIADKFLKLMPGFPELFARAWRKIENTDIRHTATAIAKMQSELESYVIKPTEQEGKTLTEICHLFTYPSVAEAIRQDLTELARKAKKDAAADNRYSLLLELITKADERLPLISLAILRDHAHPIKSLRPQYEPADLIEEAKSSRGERKARAVIRAYREIAEWLYDPYLLTLWRLTCFAKAEWQPEPEKFGSLVVQISQKLSDYPGLVEADAGWRRNAAAHGPNWEYIHPDTLRMQDKRHPWSDISVEELFSKTISMYQIAGSTLTHVAQLYMLRNVGFNTGLADVFINNFPQLFSSDEMKRVAAEEKIRAKAEKVFGPLKSFLAANSQPTAA